MPTSTNDTRSFLEQMRDRFALAQEALSEIHEEARRDWQFRLGEQWDSKIKAQRDRDGRPCWTINRIPQFLRQVSGEQRKNRPGIEISPVGDGSDVETAEIMQGITRHIERVSDADHAYDTAFDHMLTGGFGFLRVITEYIDDSDDQEIKIVREANSFAHYPDPHAKQLDYSDARFWFVEDVMARDDFEREYPNADATTYDFAALATLAPDWIMRDSVRVVEYFWIEETTEKAKKGKRAHTKKTVRWCKTNGVEILDEAELPGQYIPIVPVLGEEITVDGKRHLIGLIRNARAPQELYNIWQSAMAETIALAPKAPYMATPTQIEGYEDLYEQANTSNLPYLPYNADPKAPEMPRRQVIEPPIQAITSAIAHADNDLHSTTGLYDASLGERGPEQSGKAILLRQKQGDSAVFGFQDSMTRAIKHLGRIVVSWIPIIYDTAREVRIVNPDGTSEMVPINQPYAHDSGLIKCHDLTVGRYDVAISSGPSYDTMREEAAQSMLQLVQAQPALMSVVGDLLVKCFDWPMAQEISERLKKMLPPELQEQGQADPQVMQQKLAQSQAMIQQLTAAVHKLSAAQEAKQIDADTRIKVALINARAGVLEAWIKAESDAAKTAFQAELDQIDRQLALLPDPKAQPDAGAPQQPAPMPQAA